MENSKKPAFPLPMDRPITHEQANGLTKREYAAIMAMQGILANPLHAEQLKVQDYWIDTKTMAEMAVEAGDNLLKQLNK